MRLWRWIVSLLQRFFKTGFGVTPAAAETPSMPPSAPPVRIQVPARVKTVVQTPTGMPDIRLFDVNAINEAIEKNVSLLEPEDTFVATGFIDQEGAKVAVAVRMRKLPFGIKVPGDFRWTVMHVEPWRGAGRKTQAGLLWKG